MPSAEELKTNKAENPRYDAIKDIVQSRLNETSTTEGKSMKESMEDQGMIIDDPDLDIGEEVLDSDTDDSLVGKQDVDIDINDEVIEPNEAKKVEPEVEPEVVPEPEEEFYDRDGEHYTKIKVNGEMVEISASELKASAQKDKASFARFKQAAQKEQELSERETALEGREAALAAKEIVTEQIPAKVETPSTTEPTDVVDELYDALAYEDEDTVKAKIAELVSGQAQTKGAEGREQTSTQTEEPVDIQAEVNAVLNKRAQTDWETSRVAAVSQWEINYDDIASDPELRAIANMQSKRIAEAHPDQPLEQTLNEAGDFARKWRGLEDDTTLVVDVDTTSRTAAKQKAQAPVRTNGQTANRKVKDNKPQTRSEIVAQIRAGRGQAAA